MIRLLLPIVQRFRRFYWWLVRPTTRGVRVIVVNQTGDVLLVKRTYQKGWFLPGGKTRKNENDEDALRRELREEIGVEIVSTPRKLGEYTSNYEYKKDTIVVFILETFTQKDIKHFEVEKYNFFKPEILPENTSLGTRKHIKEWLKKQPINNQW